MTEESKSTCTSQTEQLHLTSRFTSAVDYARHIHIERRKGNGIPYMAHLLGVAALVMGEAGHISFPVTEDMVIAAFLHDAAEDHRGLLRLTDIKHNFGANVARMVEGLSDPGRSGFLQVAVSKPPTKKHAAQSSVIVGGTDTALRLIGTYPLLVHREVRSVRHGPTPIAAGKP